MTLKSLEIKTYNKLDFAFQFVQQPVIQLMRCDHHTTDAVMSQNSPTLAQTAPKWTTNTKIRGFSFSQMEVVLLAFVLNFDHVSTYFKHCIALHIYRKG